MKHKIQLSIALALPAAALMFLAATPLSVSAGTTVNPWPSFRHDLLNSGAAPDSGYPANDNVAWKVPREPDPWFSSPASARVHVTIDKGMVFSTGSAIVQANDTDNGQLVWSRSFPLQRLAQEPADAPSDWCYNDIPSLSSGAPSGVCYVENLADCPSWCFECTDVEPDCSLFSLTDPLQLPVGYKQFIAGGTLDSSYGDNGCIIFGTFDGRVISLDMLDGSTIWERTPFKDPGGPSHNAPWYDNKFAWHLSPPTMYNGKVYIGSFFPSWYPVFRPWTFTEGTDYKRPAHYPWPTIEHDVNHYWVGRDGCFYALDQDTGSILWTWDPQGCGVTSATPVVNGKVFMNADTVTDYHYGQFVTVDAETGTELWHHGTIPLAQGGSMPVSGDTIYFPGGDGALWALDINTAQVKWTYWAGFNVKGSTGMENTPAVDELHNWIIGAGDTGKLFVLNKDTGRVVKEAVIGLPSWSPGDPLPESGYWLTGSSGICLAPQDGLLYISATDFDHAWQGQFNYGKEKLFCFDYVSDPDTLIPLWEYQFCKNDDCSESANELVVRGQPPMVISWYSLPTPALSDGAVYYSSYNGYIYKFGSSGPTLIVLSSFEAVPKSGRVELQWSTESEIDTAGFNIYRSVSESGPYIVINTGLIPPKGSATQGAAYTFTDNTVLNRTTYWYKLEDVDRVGKGTTHGPVRATPRLLYAVEF